MEQQTQEPTAGKLLACLNEGGRKEEEMKSKSQKVWDHVDFTGHWEGFTLKSPQKQGKPEDNGTAIKYWKAKTKRKKAKPEFYTKQKHHLKWRQNKNFRQTQR